MLFLRVRNAGVVNGAPKPCHRRETSWTEPLRLTFNKSVALLIGVGAALLLLAGWRLESPQYLAFGIATLVVLFIFGSLIVYRHVVRLLGRIDQLDQRFGVSISMAQRSARADKIQARASGELAASQHRFQTDLTGFSSKLDAMAKRLQASEEALRVAARQSGDAIDMTLRVFRELELRQEEINRDAAKLAGQMHAFEMRLKTSLETMSGKVVHATRSAVSSAMDEPSRQLHRVLGHVESTHSELAPFIDVTGKQIRQLIRNLQSHQDGLAPFTDVAGKQLRQLIRDVASVKSVLGPVAEASEKQIPRILKEITTGKSAVAEFLQNNRKLKDLTKRAMYETVQEVEALSQLEKLFTGALPRPLLGGFAMTPTAMLALVGEILRSKPALVVEFGSGTSTVWLAQAFALNGEGRLVSIEHLQEFYDKTLAALQVAGLGEWVDLRLAPLEEIEVNGEIFNWYASSAVQGLREVDIFIVDGPPGFTGRLARYPAVPLLEDSLADRSLVVVDDADREDELATIERWRKEIGSLGESRALSPRTQVIPYQRAASAAPSSSEF